MDEDKPGPSHTNNGDRVRPIRGARRETKYLVAQSTDVNSLCELVNEALFENDSEIDDSDQDPDYEDESNHSTDSEQNVSGDEEDRHSKERRKKNGKKDKNV